MSNPIVTENLNTGTTAWLVTNAATSEIQAYVDATAYNAGSTVTFFVSTQVAGAAYSVTIYRLGYYGGTGACQKAQTTGRVGVAQGYWTSGAGLVSCPTAIIDGTTHLTEAGWTSTDTWAIPSNAVPGVYIAQFTDANGKQTYCNFVVRGKGNEDYVYVRPYTTDAAYTQWGGYSLYQPGGGPATKVSFNRPSERFAGCAGLFQYEINGIKWLESQGYNLAYLSNVDLHSNGSQLLSYKAYLSAGHDEYWSLEIRNAVESARASGIGLAFFGANACYWQIRMEADAASHANRTVVCYKVASGTYSNDPDYGVDDTRITTQWRDIYLRKPENALIGIMYYDNTQGSNYAWAVDASATPSYLTGTGLVDGTSYGSDLVGNEWDNTLSSPGSQPAGLQIIGTSSATGVNHGTSNSNTTTYIGVGGALVFATGSLGLTYALDAFRYQAANVAVIPGIQALFAHIMTALIRPKNPTGFSSFASGHR